jgi:hypothetical protein
VDFLITLASVQLLQLVSTRNSNAPVWNKVSTTTLSFVIQSLHQCLHPCVID